jgi:hypothetical protein
MFNKVALSILAALVVSFASRPAFTDSFQRSTSCIWGYGAFFCTTWGTASDPYIRRVPSSVGAEERNRKWVADCHPKIFRDRYGVGRYHYAAPQCEFGVADPDG